MPEKDQSRNNQEIAEKLQSLQSRFTSGQITKENFLAEFGRLAAQLYKGAQDEEQRRLKQAEERLGIESLSTDTSGRRSTQWFAQTKKPFATGVATRCLVAAAIHPDTGMGAAHKNFISLDVLGRSTRMATDAFLAGQPLGLKRPNDMLTDEDIRVSTMSVICETIRQFERLLPSVGRLKGRMIFALAGLNFLPDPAQKTVLQLSIETMQECLHTIPRQVDVSVEVIEQIGICSGIIYGGQYHPQYFNPVFYTL